MKSSRIKIAIAFVAAAFWLSGCGEKLYVLTPEEQDAIVSYASRVVSKYNTNQTDGEVFVFKDVLENGYSTEEETEEGAEAAPPSPAEDVTEPEPSGEAPPDGEPSDAQKQQEAAVTLSEALDLGDISADYAGNRLCGTYEKSDVYAVDADPGQQLLVLNVNLKNPTGQDVQIDLLKMSPVFQAVVNGTQTAVAQTTILPNDLSTYQGGLSAGASAETVLLLQIPEEIKEISELQLKVTMGGETSTVNL